MQPIYIGVGSNIGNRFQHIHNAAVELSKLPQTRLMDSAPVYETDPVGGPPQDKFLNTVWQIDSELTPRELMQSLIKIEKKLGRVRGVKNGPRVIDLDILFYGGQYVQEEDLQIPHPRLQDREFILKPLADLNEDWEHPVLKKTIRTLLRERLETNKINTPN